jgi:hypothetical protein
LSNFPIVATILSMVLGLSVTRLLMGGVDLFRVRRTTKLDWVPIAWAAILFAMQLEFWWAVNSLPTVKATFSFPEFLLLVLLTLTLFVSAALLLPSRSEDTELGLREYFELDGRYALLSISAFLFLGLVVNVMLFEMSPLSVWGALDAVMIILPICAFAIKSRKVYSAITLLYVPVFAMDLLISLAN